MEVKSIAIGVVATLLVVGGIGGMMFGLSQIDESPIDQSEPQAVNESTVPTEVSESYPGSKALKSNFSEQYQYDSRVIIQNDGQVMLYYTSEAANGNQLKSEMKEIALLYADVAAENPNIGALTIQANGVLLTIPADSAIAHGEGRLDEEAYFETVRFESMEQEE